MLERLEQVEIPLVAVLHFERPEDAPAAFEVDLDGVGITGVVHHSLHIRIAPAGVDPQLYVVESLDFPVEGIDHELHFCVVLAISICHEVKGRLFDLDTTAACVSQCQQLLVHRFRHVPNDLALVLVFGCVNVKEECHDLRATRAKLDGLACFCLRNAPQLRIIEGPVLDLSDNMRPPPAGIDLVQERAGRIMQPWCCGLLRLQVISFKARPTLQRVVVPGPARHVLIYVEVAVRKDVEAGAFLVANDYSHRILELLTKADVEHTGIQRAAPHADIEPTRAWK